MGNNYIQDIKRIIGGICFKVFLWSICMTLDQYMRTIYEQERDLIKE